MSDTEFDVVIAAYLIRGLAWKDFDGLVQLVADKQLEVEGIALVSVDAGGEITVDETDDHLGRKGMKTAAGVGLVVGLLCPPLLASVIVGGTEGDLVGRFVKHKVESGLGEKMGGALPPNSAGIVAIYDRAKTEVVNAALEDAVKMSAAQVDGDGAKQLKAALGLGGYGRRLTRVDGPRRPIMYEIIGAQ